MYEYNCKIVRVVDGDTVDVDVDLGFNLWKHGERIRLFGIDTEEVRTKDAEEKASGLEAKAAVERMLHKGGTYRLVTEEKDKYGRYLGYIYVAGKVSVNDALLRAGLAVPYTGQSKEEIHAAHIENRRKRNAG